MPADSESERLTDDVVVAETTGNHIPPSFEPVRSHEARLLVFGPDLATSVPLPARGELVVGRGSDADVTIVDPSISRRHLAIHVGPPLTVRDLGSVNGTRVGRVALAGGEVRQFEPGDPVELGHSTLVVQRGGGEVLRTRRVWTHGYFELRVEEECGRDRADPFAVVRLKVTGSPSAQRVEGALHAILDSKDSVALYAPMEWEVLLASSPPARTARLLESIRLALEKLNAGVRFGVAQCPEDGHTAEALLAQCGTELRGAPEESTGTGAERLVVADPNMRRLYELAHQIAKSEISVLILGETGVGKEVLARDIHRRSRRAAGPFLALNCGALPEPLLESELFGHERGAFTGAHRAKAGLLETAQNGTVFLDEVSELPFSTQVKFLRVLEERCVRRVGGLHDREIDVRFIAASNRDLEKAANVGAFRQDLFYRLNGISLPVPPLRERLRELPALVKSFALQAHAREGHRPDASFTRDAMEALLGYPWPGNVRELRNVIERAVVLSDGEEIEVAHLPMEKLRSSVIMTPPSPGRPVAARESTGSRPAARTLTDVPVEEVLKRIPKARSDPSLAGALASVEEQRIVEALETCAGNQTRAAQLLGISRKVLLNRIERYGIPRPRKR